MYTAISEGAAAAMMPGSMVAPWLQFEQPRLLGTLGAEMFSPDACRSPWAGKKPQAPTGIWRGGYLGAGPGYEPGYVLASCADLGSPLPHPLALHERFAIPADVGGAHAQWAGPAGAKHAQATCPSWALDCDGYEIPRPAAADAAEATRPLSPEHAGRLGSPELPTEGSLLHNNGCKPCVFLHKEGGCKTGPSCKFCHLCQPDEKKIRKKTWKQMKRLEASLSLAPEDGGIDSLANDSFDRVVRHLFQSAL